MQPTQTAEPFLAMLNLLFIVTILGLIALLVTRRNAERKQMIEGFRFMHEVEPLLPFEPLELYYLF